MGINGQDGSYLAEFLLSKGYEIIGWIPSTIPISFENIQNILDKITLTKGNLLDQKSLNLCVGEYCPDEIYNLASPSSPTASWDETVLVTDVTALGVARLLESIRLIRPQTRYYQSSSSELFGNPVEVPQKETTPFHPRNPYGIAKLCAHWLTVRYREHYNLSAVSGILFNHESPRRDERFVTRKITRAVAAIKAGKQKELSLGNLEARRDWGYAPDYVAAMWKMLHVEPLDDFVVGTGEANSVREFLDEAFGYADLDWHDYVKIDERYFRPTEVVILQSDPSKARRVIGWEPRVSFQDLVKVMVDADLELIGLKSPGEGRKIVEKHYGMWHRWEGQVVSSETVSQA
jgi:GDPmannose 4,6-dehydratase